MNKLIPAFLVALSLSACIQTAPPPNAGPPAPTAQTPTPVPAPASAKRPDGQSCSSAGDCDSGICEGQGCGQDMGVCVSANRMCTMDLVPYCGCDGETFTASSGCAGRLYARRGECGTSAGQPLPAGSACNQGSDCASGVCEGMGCGPGQGVCAAANRICTRDLVDYCGCDGQSFSGSGTCPGQRYEKRGACDAPAQKRPAGASCDTADDCESGICEGMGCGPGEGVCAAKRRACTRDLRPYCGCDGKTFRASGTCPNRRFSKRGECP